MTLLKYLILLSLSLNIIHAENIKINRCATKDLSLDEKFNPQERTIADCTTTLTSISSEYWPKSLILQIPIWFHIIYKSNGTGNVSDASINAQVQALNEDYRAVENTKGQNGYDSKIQFTLAGITRTQNDSWFDYDNADAYKPALAKDTSKYLNIYSTTASGNLGYAFFPQGNPGIDDGIVLLHSSIGGRDNGFSQYDQGRTLVHEMGHYLGLYHTFEGGSQCLNDYQNGDLIFDTNAESSSHDQCIQTSTCGTKDPIYNYMNYTPDTCMNQFTAEQANRMVCSTINYRPSVFTLINTNPNNNIGSLIPVFSLLLNK